MNLLQDKREQERQWHDKEFSGVSADSTQTETPEQSGLQKPPRSKKSGVGFLVAIVVIAVAVIIIYFGFYRPRQPVDSEPSVTEQEMQPEGGTETDQEPALTQGEREPEERQVVVSSQPSSIAMAATILQRTSASLSAGDEIGTMVFDEGSFSAEIVSSSVENAAATYDRLIASLPSEIEINSSRPTAGNNVLVSGTYTIAEQPDAAADVTEETLESTIRTIADQTAATLSSFTMNEQSGGQTFVFVKVNASLEGCQQFLQQLSQEISGMNVSKLIMMPGTAGQFVCVLRFFL